MLGMGNATRDSLQLTLSSCTVVLAQMLCLHLTRPANRPAFSALMPEAALRAQGERRQHSHFLMVKLVLLRTLECSNSGFIILGESAGP